LCGALVMACMQRSSSEARACLSMLHGGHRQAGCVGLVHVGLEGAALPVLAAMCLFVSARQGMSACKRRA